jgi:broad specificity phosphatase PhoE
VQRRMKPFAEKLRASRARTIAVVSHLDVTRVLLAELMDGKMTEYAKAKQPNDCVYIVDTAGKAVRNWRSGKEAEGLLQ